MEQNTSITHCLRGFSNTETLCSEYKYYCEECRSKQEAHKRMKVKKLPMILALHLKRFKYMDQLHRYTKLSYRVVFPLELRLFNTSGDATNPDRMYDLVAVVVHCGSGPNRGHYIAIVKSHDFWLLFDDDIVEKIDAQAIEEFYGLTSDISKNSESGYILSISPGTEGTAVKRDFLPHFFSGYLGKDQAPIFPRKENCRELRGQQHTLHTIKQRPWVNTLFLSW